MKGVRAAVRYAKAFNQLATEKKLLDVVINDIKLIADTIDNSKDLALMLQSPLVKAEQKSNVLKAVFTGKVNELTVDFIQQLVAQGRENILGFICAEFVRQYNELKNIAQVTVTTTTPLSKEIRENLIAKIKEAYQFSEIELEEKIDEDLIGGLLIRIGDKQLDASIRRQLIDIKQELIHA